MSFGWRFSVSGFFQDCFVSAGRFTFHTAAGCWAGFAPAFL
jgi:hypothetical protein